MSGSHGDLFLEIGKLAMAAQAGEPINLSAKSEEMAERYGSLHMQPELIAKMLARSLGAVSASMAIVDDRSNEINGHLIRAVNGRSSIDVESVNGDAPTGDTETVAPSEAGFESTESGDIPIELTAEFISGEDAGAASEQTERKAKAASLFPSGLRIAVLS